MLGQGTSMNASLNGRVRSRFVFWVFLAGAVVPVALIAFGSALGERYGGGTQNGNAGIAVWVLTWIVWPTWILFLDAEHLPTILFMLLLAAPLNGLWYVVVGVFLRYLYRGLKRFQRR